VADATLPWWVALLQERLADHAERVGATEPVQLLPPAFHRDAWLGELLLRSPSMFGHRLALRRPAGDLLAPALNAASGVIIELPRLDEDAWAGDADPRLRPVWRMMEAIELPEAPPRAALHEVWTELRARVPFSIGPRTTFAPPVFKELKAYLDALERAVDYQSLPIERIGVEEVDVEPLPRPGTGEPVPLEPEMLAAALMHAVDRHLERSRVLLRDHIEARWWEFFPLHRDTSARAANRDEKDRLAEGWGLRKKSHLRYHLAAWILKQADLPYLDIGLFRAYVDPSGLQNRPPAAEREAWREGIEKAVENSLASWSGAERGPVAHLGEVEFAMHDLLRWRG
jgi:hypothetical protein